MENSRNKQFISLQLHAILSSIMKWAVVQEAYPTEWDSPQGAVVPVETPFVCATCGANWVVLCSGLKPTSKYGGSGASWEGLRSRPRSATACDWARSYLVGATKICSCSLPVLTLREAHVRGHAANQRQLPPAPGQG